MLQLIDIHKKYNPMTNSEVHALKGINFDINEGDFIAIMGVSGSGKSTLLHILGTLDTPTDGKYLFNGKNVDSFDDADLRNKHIGFALQDFGLIDSKTVYENVATPLYFCNNVKYKEIEEKVNEALKSTGVFELKNKLASQISGGQKQRVAISRAIVNDPSFILADEPTAALDSATADEIMNLFINLNNEGKTIIIVTHDKRIAQMCKKIIYIKDGLISEE